MPSIAGRRRTAVRLVPLARRPLAGDVWRIVTDSPNDWPILYGRFPQSTACILLAFFPIIKLEVYPPEAAPQATKD